MNDIERYHDRPLDIEVAQGLDTLPPTVEGRRLTTASDSPANISTT